MVCKHRSILMSMHCIELTCLTTGDDPLCLASQRGTNARRRPRRSRMLRSPFWFLRPDMAGFPWMEGTSLSDCQIRSIQKLNSVFASEMRNCFEILLWRVKSIRNRSDKVYSSDKDPIHDMLLDLPHIVGTLSGYLGSPALRAAFTCSKMERLTGLWERLGELSQRPGAAPTPKSSPTEDQSPANRR